MTSYRRHGRTPMKCAVKLEHEALGEVYGETRDMSETGFFVQSKELVENVSVGDACTLEMVSEEARSKTTQFTVARLAEDGVGLCYE